MNYELHPLCTLFPRLGDAEFSALVEDIKANGLRQPITLHDGMILDGGNRYRACITASVAPRFVQFDGGNIVSFVLSANLHRRHLSAGQQAAIVASAQDWAKAQTVGRPEKGADKPISTLADRMAVSGASRDTQKRADKIAREAPELARKVAHGEISLPKAVEQVTGKRPGAKPASTKPETPEPEDDGAPSDEEIAEAEAAEAAEREFVEKLIASDDRLKAASNEVRRLNAMVVSLNGRITGLSNELNAAKRQAEQWRRKFEALERKAGKASA